MSKTKKGTKTLVERIFNSSPEDTGELPAIAGAGLAKIELTGNREISVDGCRGILEYDESVVRLNLGNMIIKITGAGLTIPSMTAEQTTVTGSIAAVEFSS